VPFRDIAQAIGRGLNLPVTAISREEPDGHFGLYALFPSSEPVTRAQARITRRPAAGDV
jgi:hypothetical protein